jgi:hypothetical protein
VSFLSFRCSSGYYPDRATTNQPDQHHYLEAYFKGKQILCQSAFEQTK